MTILRRLLAQKDSNVWTIDPNSTVYDAIERMSEKDIGSLIVVEGGKVVGMLTERLYAREVILKGRSSAETQVKEIMETKVPFVEPHNNADESMAIMINEFVRYLPVMEDGKLVGLVSMGDLVKAKVADQEFIIDEMTQYIHGTKR
jgi:CBS domain-containing protein